MNQILDYSPNKGDKKSSGSDKIVNFFAVIMIVFAVILIAGAGYNLYQRNKESENVVAQVEKAEISVEQRETEAVIMVRHTKVIEKIFYSWNNSQEKTIKGTGTSEVEEIIKLPAGDNSLNIKVIDIDGGETTYSGQFYSETGVDILNPVIKLEVTDEKKLRIIATDDTSLDFITYRWNDGEEVKVRPEEDNKKIQIEIDILKDTNDLMISAVDSNNNTTTEQKRFTGLTKPEVTIVLAADKKSAQITVKHENGLKELKLNLNNVDYPIDLGSENPKEFSFIVNLMEGKNKIIVTAISVDNTEIAATEEVDNTIVETEEPTEEQPAEEPSTTEEVQISLEKTEDGQNAYYKASHSSGIKEIRLNINDMDLDLSALGTLGTETKEIEFLVPLYDGNNKIVFTVVPMDGNEKQEVKEIVK